MTRGFLPLLLLLAACDGSGLSPEDSGIDAGTVPPDTGLRDAHADSARPGDAEADASFDAGADPGWLRVTGVPTSCRTEIALDPHEALPPLQFEACPGEAGCRQVVVDWPWGSADLGPLYLFKESAADETHSYFTWGRPVRRSSGLWVYLTVARDDGTPLLTMRYPRDEDPDDKCWMTQLAITPSSFAFSFVHQTGSDVHSYPVRARFSDPLESWAFAESRPSLVWPAVGAVWTTDERSVLDTSGTDWIMEADGSLVVLDLPSFAGIDMMQDDVIYASELRADGWHVVRFLPGQATSEVLIAPNADGEAAMFRRHGDTVTWHRLIGPITGTRYERAELWTGRMVDEGIASPRRVAELELPTYRGSSQQRFGWVWEIETLERFALYDTRSGAERTYNAPEDRIVPSPPVLGPSEIGVPVGYRRAALGLETIRFYEYEALPLAATE